MRKPRVLYGVLLAIGIVGASSVTAQSGLDLFMQDGLVVYLEAPPAIPGDPPSYNFFSVATVAPGGSVTFGVSSAGDIDGDGDLDVVAAMCSGGPPTGNRNQVCFNDGTGVFTCSLVDNVEDCSVGAALLDIDGQNGLDIFFANGKLYTTFGPGEPNRVCYNDGANPPSFSCADVSTTGDPAIDARGSLGMATGDMNGDGFPDVVYANDAQASEVCLNDGMVPPTFTCLDLPLASPPPGSGQNGGDAGVGDLDGDNDLDIVLVYGPNGGQNGVDRVCLNDGLDPPSFSCSSLGSAGHLTFEATLGDLDGDNDLDIVLANFFTQLFTFAPDEICYNDGMNPPSFSCGDLDPALAELTGQAIIEDFDLDSDPDIMLIALTGGNQLCRNDGTGLSFDCSPIAGSGLEAAVGDFDGPTCTDNDGDGYGDPGDASCLSGSAATDCDDGDSGINPGASEILCDAIDQNCNGAADDDVNGDGDPVSFCAGDCDDGNDQIYPGNSETLCDGLDNDCDALSTDDVNFDGDPVSFCAGDCDDGDADNYPGNAEVCDGQDNNCDTAIDEGTLDSDSDLVCDAVDNCPADANSGQENCDGDSDGDVCDLDDPDGDGLTDAQELNFNGGTCPGGCPDPLDSDTDDDGLLDGFENDPDPDRNCDICLADTDGDGVQDAMDPFCNDATLTGDCAQDLDDFEAYILSLPTSVFQAPGADTEQQKNQTRAHLASIIGKAAKHLDKCKTANTINELQKARDRVDGAEPPLDDMVAGTAEKAIVLDTIDDFLYLLSMGLCAC